MTVMMVDERYRRGVDALAALRYWPLDEMQDWHPAHDRYARAAYEAWQAGKPIPAVYD